jgi:hypothetical protein
MEPKRTFTKFPEAHRKLGSSWVTPSHLRGFTSKSNKFFMSIWCSPKCTRLWLMLHCSYNLNLSTQLKDFAHKAWILQGEDRESSRGYWHAIQMVRNKQHMSEGVEAFYSVSEKTSCWIVRPDRSIIPVWPVGWPLPPTTTTNWLRALSTRNTLIRWIGSAPGLVQITARVVQWEFKFQRSNHLLD